MSMDTPLLLIAWRRPHTLRQLIDAIRPLGPTRLYVACDGSNPERLGEADKVAATRAVIEHDIDWPCQIEYYFGRKSTLPPWGKGARGRCLRPISCYASKGILECQY